MRAFHTTRWKLTLALAAFLLAALTAASPAATAAEVSGRLEAGLRILPIDGQASVQNFTVYRGDYIKFDFPVAWPPTLLEIPALDIRQRLSPDLNQAPYFKMKTSGRFAFSLGRLQGEIAVVDFQPAHYQELTAAEAFALITTNDPLRLDVRTPKEYAAGHLEGARLLPVQALQARIAELDGYREREILIYCATGNRSTVAAKILIDSGFTRIYNLRHGIAEWERSGYPVVR
jgi:rhodanese-related sulfurtransferase